MLFRSNQTGFSEDTTVSDENYQSSGDELSEKGQESESASDTEESESSSGEQ